MSVFRANTIKHINANQVASDFTAWCNNKSNCLYKNKKRKFHGWLNLTNLATKNKVAQCGWDDGDCNHTTHYGVGGYHNVCPIGGFNGDLPWPAKLQFSNFKFASNGITSTAKVKSITVHFEHRMVGIDTGTGIIYDNFGPTFHNSSGGWACKVYFTNGSNIVSTVKKYPSNPKLSKKEFSSIEYTFNDVTISELLNTHFALNIEYNHNYNINPGIIYLKNVYIDVKYEDAKIYIKGSSDKTKLYTSQESECYTEIYHTIEAGYENENGVISSSKAPAKLGSKIQCIEKPQGVTVTQISSDNSKKKFKITDTSNIAGNKTIQYNLSNHTSEKVSLEYTATVRPKPSYDIIREYKFQEDFDSSKQYMVFKNGCASSITIYIDSVDADSSNTINLDVTNQNSTTNLLNSDAIQTFHNKIKTLSCGYHTLYIKRGAESMQDVKKNKVQIKISPMQFKFDIYTNENPQHKLEFAQHKSTSENNSRYSTILIKRTDNEPRASLPSIKIGDETQPSESIIISPQNGIKKGDIIEHTIDKYYAGEYYITVSDPSPCSGAPTKAKITINSSHKQNYDFLFTRGEKGSAFDFDYLVAWEGDNIKEPLLIDSISLQHSIDDIKICSDPVQSGLSQIGLIKLNVKNKTNEDIEGIEIELNTLIDGNNGKEVTTSEWTEPDGIFNQFYTLFSEYNITLSNNVQVLNLTPDNDLVDEENVYLFINKIEALDTITIYLPFRSTVEKTVYLQYLLFETPLKIHSIANCNGLNTSNDLPTDIEINICDSMLTKLEINGNTDLLVLDQSYACPDECYTTKEVNELYEPIGDNQSGGITYKITNIDTNDFDAQSSTTEIINSNELIPYGYIVDDEYYALIDNNGDPINVQENRPLLDYEGNPQYEPLTDSQGNLILDENNQIQYDETKPLYQENKLQWVQDEVTVNKPMANHNIVCHVQFPYDNELTYTIKTNKNGLAEFFIPIPTSLNTRYTIDELLTNVLYFEFKEQKEYNGAILTKNNAFTNNIIDINKNEVIIDYGNNYKRYNPGDIAYIPIFLSANIKVIQNHFTFNADLHMTGQSDQVTILYKVCNLDNNEGIFKTTFKTNDKQLIPNQISKNVYCGIDSQLDTNVKINKRIVESMDLNIIYLDIINKQKENKDVEVQIDLGKRPVEYLGNYDFIDINIKSGDSSIIEDDDQNLYINWLIGEMDSFEKQTGIIKIKAKDIGLSDIQVKTFDYLHNSTQDVEIKKSKCNKCQDVHNWQIADSLWKEFNGVWYKLFPDGTYKKPVKTILVNGKYQHQWVDKE